MLAVAIPAGLLIGLALGALGGGGSILTVPALVYLLDQAPHAATTGSLLIVGTAALVGMVAHRRAGRVRIGPGLVFAGLGLAGSYVGSRLSTAVDPHVLLTAFAALMLAAAAALRQRGGARRHAAGAPPQPGSADRLARARAHHRAALADGPATAGPTCPLPSVTPRITTRRAVTIVAAATAVGLLTGFFGVGGGFVIVPALVLVLGFDMPAAVGTSLLVIAVTSAAALAARLGGQPDLDWSLLGLFAATAIAGSVAGNRLAAKVDESTLRGAFVVLLLAVAVYTGARSIPYLL